MLHLRFSAGFCFVSFFFLLSFLRLLPVLDLNIANYRLENESIQLVYEIQSTGDDVIFDFFHFD